jgi:hypothetical protein
MYEAAASCKDVARAPVTNWEPQRVTLAGYCYAVRHGMKVLLVTPYRVSHWQRYQCIPYLKRCPAIGTWPTLRWGGHY